MQASERAILFADTVLRKASAHTASGPAAHTVAILLPPPSFLACAPRLPRLGRKLPRDLRTCSTTHRTTISSFILYVCFSSTLFSAVLLLCCSFISNWLRSFIRSIGVRSGRFGFFSAASRSIDRLLFSSPLFLPRSRVLARSQPHSTLPATAAMLPQCKWKCACGRAAAEACSRPAPPQQPQPPHSRSPPHPPLPSSTLLPTHSIDAAFPTLFSPLRYPPAPAAATDTGSRERSSPHRPWSPAGQTLHP